MTTVTSRQHPFVRRCRQVAAGRGEPGVVLLDGVHLLADAVAAGLPIDGVLATERRRGDLAALADRLPSIYYAPDDVLASASPVRTPTGMVALARWAPAPIDALPPTDAPLVGLVDVQDPGNVGNIIRSADAFGAGGVLVLDGSADPGGWKCLRAAMGSTFRVPVARGLSATAIALARARGLRVAAATARGGRPPSPADATAPLLLLIGSEGAGLPDDLIDAADVCLTLPMRPGIESLNAATTAAVLLWELHGRTARLSADASP